MTRDQREAAEDLDLCVLVRRLQAVAEAAEAQRRAQSHWLNGPWRQSADTAVVALEGDKALAELTAADERLDAALRAAGYLKAQ